MTKPRSKIRNVAKEHKESISKLDKIAVAVTRRVGTMTFFLSILIWTVIWLSWNLLAPQDLKFDPPMSFTFWLFLSNLIQILLMPLIMLGQNLQGAHAERRSENDFEVNVKAEEEIQEILVELKELKQMIRLLSEKVNGKD